jgi:hypothetical protein
MGKSKEYKAGRVYRFERSKAPRELWAKEAHRFEKSRRISRIVLHEHRFKIIQRESQREYVVRRPADLRHLAEGMIEKIRRWLKWR